MNERESSLHHASLGSGLGTPTRSGRAHYHRLSPCIHKIWTVIAQARCVWVAGGLRKRETRES